MRKEWTLALTGNHQHIISDKQKQILLGAVNGIYDKGSKNYDGPVHKIVHIEADDDRDELHLVSDTLVSLTPYPWTNQAMKNLVDLKSDSE